MILPLIIALYITLTAAHVTPRLDAPKCTARTSWESPTGANPIVQLDSWGPDSIRIRIALDDILITPPIQALQPFPPELSTECSVSPTQSSLKNGNIQAAVDSAGHITVTRASDGATLLSSSTPSFTPFMPSPVFPSPYTLYFTEVSYTHAAGKISGLGEHKVDTYEPRYKHLFENSQLYSQSSGGDITIPFYTSSAGFAVLFNHAGYGYVDISSTDATWIANATHQVDLWITTIPATPVVQSATVYPPLLSNYAQVVGHPNVLPPFASGFWQSKDRYRSQAEVLNISAGFAQRNIPVAIFVIDWLHWAYEGSWDFTPLCWPDPASMVKAVSELGFRTMISMWPTVDTRSSHFAAMNASGFLTRGADGKSLSGKPSENTNYVYDSFNPDSRDFVWNALVKGYVSRGIKLFWLDNDEPDGAYPGAQYFYGRSDREVAMAWVVKHQQMIYDGLIQSGVPLSELIMLSRSAWVGTANNNVVVWSGDTNSDWTTFAQQIKVAQQTAMSGIYWWTTDIAGYRSGDITQDTMQELLVRWFQFGVFCPIFRTHGHREPSSSTECGYSGAPNEFWTFKYAAQIEKLIFLRESIRPYVERHLTIASINGTPILRPMYYDFNDTICETTNDQYMFGDLYLVAPVYIYQATWRTVYLPAGETWRHYFSGTTYMGGQTVNITTTLNDFPLFTRSSVIDMTIDNNKPVILSS